ncbi:hypothetical protein J2T21_000079 [Paeniglutamicibacter psychrophenolicus]|nr:hypothetical protein [Paeniglutamicibacter psychrophenolicus]
MSAAPSRGGHGVRGAVPGRVGAGSLDEQAHRGGGVDLCASGAESRDGQRVQHQHRLVLKAQPGPAGGQQRGIGAGAGQGTCQLADLGTHVLAIIQHQQPGGRAQRLGDRLQGVVPGARFHAQHRADLGAHRGGSSGCRAGHARQVHQHGGESRAVPQGSQRLGDQAGLAHSPGPRHRHQTVGGNHVKQPGGFLLPAHEAGGRRPAESRQVSPPRAHGPRGSGVPQDALLQAFEVGGGIQPEFPGQGPAVPAVLLQCLRRPPGSGQRTHQQSHGPLPEGILRDKGQQPRRRSVRCPEFQIDGSPLLEGIQPQPIEPGGFRPGEVTVVVLLVGSSAPQSQRGIQQTCRRLRGAACGPGAQFLKVLGIGAAGREVQPVATGNRVEALSAQKPAQPRDDGVKRCRRRLRQVPAPRGIDECVCSHHVPAVQQQDRQHRPATARGQNDGDTVHGGPQGAKHRESNDRPVHTCHCPDSPREVQ